MAEEGSIIFIEESYARHGLAKVGTRNNPNQAPTKRFHAKSRTGCLACRSRRVKCDEKRPECGNCARRGEQCRYEKGSSSKSASTLVQTPNFLPLCRHVDQSRDGGENRQRRLRELEMLHSYITHVGPQTSFDSRGAMHEFWVSGIPRTSLKSEALLYALFATVSLHSAILARRGQHVIDAPQASVTDLEDEHRTYLNMALIHHGEEVAQPGAGNADSLIAVASLLRLIAFASLSDRDLVPYTPPLEWLRMITSHTQVFRTAQALGKEDMNNHAANLSKFKPRIDQKYPVSYVAHSILAAGNYLDDDEEAEEGGDPETWDERKRQAYEDTVGYLEHIACSMVQRQPIGDVGRSLVLFPQYLKPEFIDFVAQRRRRALAVLLYYFGLLRCLKSFWFIGDCCERELKAITEYIQWQGKAKELLLVVNRISDEYTDQLGL